MPGYHLDPRPGVRPAGTSGQGPTRLGRYELLGQLATGGMAEIHLARLAGEAGFEKIVVVKRLLPELVASPAYVAMFLDEGKLVARLDHPNICEVYELGRDGAEYYLAMPYLDGIAVHELIARPRDPDRISQLRVAAGVIVQACAGLHHAHELRDADGAAAHLVHRDVSPSNLFVTTAGVVKVLDFGIAKVRGAAATEVGTIKGKQQYMAPEQLLGEPLDRRCDVFALGIVLFELATHQRLFKRASDYLTAKAVLEEPVQRADAIDPAVPGALADVIAKALARDREARFADAQQLAAAVTTALAPHGGIATPPEIAAAITLADELTAQRTQKARVLADARSRITDVITATDAVPTRPMRGPAEPPTELVEVPPPARRRWVLLAASTLALGVIAGGGLYYATRPSKPAALSAPQAELMGQVADGVLREPRVVVDATPAMIEDAAPAVAVDAAPPAPPPPPPIDHVRPVKKPGLFSIDSTPYATIYIDGKRLGVTPIVKRELPAGRHKLRAVLEDGRAKEIAIEVPAGKLAAPIQLGW
ncbi:MAG TPA: serine/threonine-protein kinase [Kofleriaceae bacterium]|nr:serine/threonine-protein kinase [Kofleriaceae bacterium]